MRTWVSLTLNGASTLTSGAALSVDPATAIFPVLPGSVHSGAPVAAGEPDGQALAATAGGANTSETEPVAAEDR